jgi:Ran GTPase-activating protein (RanGAP) involved in mRNA processing and transport
LNYNNIGSSGVTEIADALEFNRSLKILYLEGNKIGVEGALALKEGLLKNCSLEELIIHKQM